MATVTDVIELPNINLEELNVQDTTVVYSVVELPSLDVVVKTEEKPYIRTVLRK